MHSFGYYPLAARSSCAFQEELPSLLRSYGLMRQTKPLPQTSACALYHGSSQVVVSPCWEMALPDVRTASLFLDARTCTAAACEVHLLVSSLTTSAFPEKRERVGYHKIVRSATSERGLFSRALSFLTFWPPSLLATPVAPTAVVDGSLIRSHRRAAIYACGPGACSGGAPPASSTTEQPWRLHPSRTHVVAFMCIGYASRPIPSN